MSHVRVLAFGYDANVVQVTGRASLNSLFEHSLNLLNELLWKRRKQLVSVGICSDLHLGIIFQDSYPVLLVEPAYNLRRTFSRWTDS